MFCGVVLLAAVGSAHPIERLAIEGSDGKREIEELLPRPLPTELTDVEIAELTRRIKNLELFDLVEVSAKGRVLFVKVERKFVITPIFDLSTGKTLKDTSGTLGAVHNDIDGHASRLWLEVGYDERSPRFGAGFYEHPYRPRSWQNEVEASYAGSSFRFDHSEFTWLRNRLGSDVAFLSPTSYNHRFRYELQFRAYREELTRVEGGSAPPDGTFLGVASEITYDRYTWNDLTPSGVRVSLELRPGAFVGPAQPRHEIRARTTAAIPLGKKTGIVIYNLADAMNAGNVNHSILVGSQDGVRGLRDALYRNRAATYATVELRHAIELRPRWYLQGVLFTDGAVFEPMDRSGRTTKWVTALSTGAGLRLLPTALVDTLLRVDLARIHAPSAAWFVQLGVSQYI